MAKPLKIEALGLQDVVAAGLNAGKNPQQIAEECSRKAKQSISNMAVRRYIEAMESTQSAAVMVASASAKVGAHQVEVAVKSNPDRVQRLVDRDIDLIELQYATTKTLADRFEWIATLPYTFEHRMKKLHDLLKQEGTDTTTLDQWGLAFTLELRRNIGSMATLNREIRQNSQFMAQLREKAFEFNLIQEYLENALDEIRAAVGNEVFESVSERLVTNPRLQRIVDQIQRLGGGEVE